MVIYELGYNPPKSDAECCSINRGSFMFNGSSLKNSWTRPEVFSLQYGKTYYDLIKMDMADIVLLSDSALQKLLPFIGESIESLPVNCSFGNFSLINTTKVIDAFDFIKSDYTVFRCNPTTDSGKPNIKFINKYSFRPEVLDENLYIFKVNDISVCPIFVTDKFKTLVEKLNLTGFTFKKIWSS